MRIGVYARGLTQKGGGGAKELIKRTTESLIDLLPDADSLFIFHTARRACFDSDRPNVHEVFLKSDNKIVADFLLAPLEMNIRDLDVIWFPKNVIPFGVKGRRVVTVLDLAYYIPELNAYKLSDTLYMKRMIKSSCKRADAIISISENTKNDIVRIFGTEPDRITTVHLGANDGFHPIGDREQLGEMRKKYDLPERFLLFTGSITPRKNLLRLVKAFNRIQDKKGYELILTGNKLYKTDNELALIRESAYVREIGFVPDEELPALYNLCDIFVYPSLYEGFGIPILEAQACGRPVISSSTSSLPEVGQSSVYYVDPYSVEAIEQAIRALMDDDGLRKDFVQKGFENVKDFSWKRAAEETLTVLRETASSR